MSGRSTPRNGTAYLYGTPKIFGDPWILGRPRLRPEFDILVPDPLFMSLVPARDLDSSTNADGFLGGKAVGPHVTEPYDS